MAGTVNLSNKLFAGLEKARRQFGEGLASDRLEGFLSLLEERLLMADCGPRATGLALEHVRAALQERGTVSGPEVKQCLRDFIRSQTKPLEKPLDVKAAQPFVIMVAGVNGGGKTTTIAKLAHLFASEGASILVSTSDTFRAAAREQILGWAKRLGEKMEFIDHPSSNPSAVAFDAVKAAVSRRNDMLILDTAGRLPNQANLMRELGKIKRTVDKALPGAPHEVLLVLDATSGRNVLGQLKAFDACVTVTGIAMTKLDGTAKGGTIMAIASEHPKPIRFVGVGEGMEDLLAFESEVFASALVSA